MFRPIHPPGPGELAEAHVAFSPAELTELTELFGAEISGRRARHLLDVAATEGWSDDEVATVALWGLTRHDVLRCALLDAAGRQWTDAELSAQLEAWGEPSDLVPYRAELVAARQLARGRLRDAMWDLTMATRAIIVKNGEVSDIEHVPDHGLRFRAVRELLRQHGGYTSKGFAATVQDELDRIEREGPGPDAHVTH